MASNLDFAEDIEEAKAYMAKKNVFQLFEVRKHLYSICFEAICCTGVIQMFVASVRMSSDSSMSKATSNIVYVSSSAANL